jgi:hypothetical protein
VLKDGKSLPIWKRSVNLAWKANRPHVKGEGVARGEGMEMCVGL